MTDRIDGKIEGGPAAPPARSTTRSPPWRMGRRAGVSDETARRSARSTNGPDQSIIYGKLHHGVPSWVPTGSRFHIRIRLLPKSNILLTVPDIAAFLIASVAFNHSTGAWYAWLVVIMPDHLHAILSFPPAKSMSRIIGDWKKYQVKMLGIAWQENYFDHRLRNDDEYVEKAHYIRMNPVRAGLCLQPSDWPWVVEPWKNGDRAAERPLHPDKSGDLII